MRRCTIYLVFSDQGTVKRAARDAVFRSVSHGQKSRKADIMRKIVLLGATAAALALGAVSANAFPNIDPQASPYAVLAPESVAPMATSEGRAALVGGEAGAWSALGAPAINAPTNPEDRNIYSRGR
jgi:hypothetical protein